MYRKIAIIAGRKHSMVIAIATVGDFTAIANSTDVMVKIPTTGIACRTTNIIIPSCCRDLLLRCACNDAKRLTREASAVAAICRLIVYSINI